jgi:hypothetical protein
MFIVRIVQNTKNTRCWGKWRLLALKHVAPSIELPVRYQMLLQTIQSVCSECLKSLALTCGLFCKHLQTLQLREQCFVEPAWLWPGRLTVYPLTVKPPNVSPQSAVLQCIFLLSIQIPVLTCPYHPLGFDSRQKDFSLFTTASRPVLGPTPPHIQWLLRALTPGIKGPGRT